jgi:hypothetical protein
MDGRVRLKSRPEYELSFVAAWAGYVAQRCGFYVEIIVQCYPPDIAVYHAGELVAQAGFVASEDGVTFRQDWTKFLALVNAKAQENGGIDLGGERWNAWIRLI